MKRGDYFKIDNGMSIYICQTGSLDMYRINRRGPPSHVVLTAQAYPEAAKQAHYTVTTLDEEDVHMYGLWKGSFYKTRVPK